jgi:RNA recognition motif-containing protein
MSEKEEIRVAVGNLPPEITEEDLQEDLEHLGYDLSIHLERSGSNDRVTAVIMFEGMTRTTAEKLADQLDGMPYRDRTLRAYVPLFLA